MITKKEASLGSTMARAFVVLIIVSPVSWSLFDVVISYLKVTNRGSTLATSSAINPQCEWSGLSASHFDLYQTGLKPKTASAYLSSNVSISFLYLLSSYHLF